MLEGLETGFLGGILWHLLSEWFDFPTLIATIVQNSNNHLQSAIMSVKNEMKKFLFTQSTHLVSNNLLYRLKKI